MTEVTYSIEEFVEMFNAALNEDGEMEQNPIWNNYYLDEKDGVKILVKRPIVIIK